MTESGFILINKPIKMSSHGVVEAMRKITGIKRIGHAGTLDPAAQGLLILGIGKEATKRISDFQKMEKEYLAKIRLGAISNTYDKEGQIEEKETSKAFSREIVERTIKKFIGEIDQSPPIFSAKRIGGERLYKLARKGIKLEIKPVKVTIYSISILNYNWPYLEINVRCSTGTYIRSLANDIGKELECGGYLDSLCRVRIGEYNLIKAKNLEELNFGNWHNFLFS